VGGGRIMIKFKAKTKLKDTNVWIEGNSLVFEGSMNEYVIFKDGIDWIDGSEWNAGDWEVIDIETLIIEK
jgi:hypothetical protein